MSETSARIGVPGWEQFSTAKTEMLAAYDSARTKAKSHPVEVGHGRCAEAEVRRWLTDFLPKRYGVTSGFVVAQRAPSEGWDLEEKLPHFDVIIYDQLDCPILWYEDNAGLRHHQGTEEQSAAMGGPHPCPRSVGAPDLPRRTRPTQ